MRKLTGVFFKPHARERGNLLRSDMKRYQRQILSLEPDFFYDDKHENIQAHLEDGTVIPFELKANLDRPGLIAFVRTVIPDASISNYCGISHLWTKVTSISDLHYSIQKHTKCSCSSTPESRATRRRSAARSTQPTATS